MAEFSDPLHEPDQVKMCSPLNSSMDLESTVDEIEGIDLPELLQNLLVSIEHAIERVPLDDLQFPCPECHQFLPLEKSEQSECPACSCTCSSPQEVRKNDNSVQSSPMFDFAASIPHIDSDEDDDKEYIKSGKFLISLMGIIYSTLFCYIFFFLNRIKPQ